MFVEYCDGGSFIALSTGLRMLAAVQRLFVLVEVVHSV
jgi:hypothetical protein